MFSTTFVCCCTTLHRYCDFLLEGASLPLYLWLAARLVLSTLTRLAVSLHSFTCPDTCAHQGLSQLLAPPMSGGTQQAADVDISVSVADDGRSVAIRMVLKSTGSGEPRVSCAPLWLFVAAPPSSSGHAARRPPGHSSGSPQGAWVMVPVDNGDWNKSVACDKSYSPCPAAQCLEALPLEAEPRQAGRSRQWEQGVGGDERGSARWMLSRWQVACPPAPSDSQVLHSEVLGVLGLEAKTSHSPNASSRWQSDSSVFSTTTGGSHEGAVAEIAARCSRGAICRTVSVLVSGECISASGAAAVDGAVLEEYGRGRKAVLALRVKLPLQVRSIVKLSMKWW